MTLNVFLHNFWILYQKVITTDSYKKYFKTKKASVKRTIMINVKVYK